VFLPIGFVLQKKTLCSDRFKSRMSGKGAFFFETKLVAETQVDGSLI